MKTKNQIAELYVIIRENPEVKIIHEWDYMCIINCKAIKTIIDDLIVDETKIVQVGKEFNKQKDALIREFGNTLPNGDSRIMPTDENWDKYEKAVGCLEEMSKEPLELIKLLIADLDKKMLEEVEDIQMFEVDIKYLPETVTRKQLELLMEFEIIK